MNRTQLSSAKQFIDSNGKGGYTFYFDNTVPSEAKTAFKRAVNSWVQLTGVNWTVSDHLGDSLVTFKNLSGSLGVTYYQWTTYPGEASWINNLKIEFNNKTNWYYGQNSGQISFMQYDFETVALHELGHCFQLRHDGDPNEIMYPTTSNGQTKRKITPNALNGALKMKSAATNISGIHYNPMQWLDLTKETNEDVRKPLLVELEENNAQVLRIPLNDHAITIYEYTISGADADLFQIDQLDGRLSFINEPDFENPKDSNQDNIYEISIKANSSFTEEIEGFEIRILDIDENTSPFFEYQSSRFKPQKFSVLEKTSEVTQIKAYDNENDSLSFRIIRSGDSFFFSIDKDRGLLEFNNPPLYDAPYDYDRNNQYEIVIAVSDGFFEERLWVQVSVTKGQDEKIISVKNDSSGNWQPGSWLGSYFQHKSGWIYHLKLGWCYLIEGADDWVWLWHNELGWMGTSEYLFPFVFINEQNDWSYLNTEIKDVSVFSYRDKSWKKIQCNL